MAHPHIRTQRKGEPNRAAKATTQAKQAKTTKQSYSFIRSPRSRVRSNQINLLLLLLLPLPQNVALPPAAESTGF